MPASCLVNASGQQVPENYSRKQGEYPDQADFIRYYLYGQFFPDGTLDGDFVNGPDEQCGQEGKQQQSPEFPRLRDGDGDRGRAYQYNNRYHQRQQF